MSSAPVHHEDAKPVVLIIDDSQDVHRLLKARLKSEDLEFVSSLSGRDGIRAALESAPSIILLDLDMPDLDGFEVLRAIKDRKETMEVPVIIVSGMHSSQDKVTAFDLGATDYVTKPFDLAELRVRVRAALRVHMLVRMLAQRAQIDGLTGLWNRQFFDRRWAEEHARVQRHPHQLSLVMLDVDHFKSVNDTFGHPAGDAVLQGLAKLLRRELRQTDVPCRYGGEEMAIIMPDTGMDQAQQTAERLRQAIEALTWPRHPERAITASMGLIGSDSGACGLSAEQWIDLADQQLYVAKRSGRNRVVAVNAQGAGGKVRLAG